MAVTLEQVLDKIAESIIESDQIIDASGAPIINPAKVKANQKTIKDGIIKSN